MRRKKQERGFALLLVFAMAASIAMLLYMEMPRAIFEAQRSKEQLLVERGEQYKRAIGLYFKKNKKWPQEIKDLEETNGIRYLRHRFVDPMTGKDEWRIIHTNGMMLTDSLVQKQQDPLKGGKDANGNPLPGGGQQNAGGFGSGSSSGFGSGMNSGSGQGFGRSGFGSNTSGGFGSSNSGFGQPQQVQQQAQAGWPGSNPAMGGVPGQPATPGQDGPLQAWQQHRPSDRPAVPSTPGTPVPVDPNGTGELPEDNENGSVFAGDVNQANVNQTGTPGQQQRVAFDGSQPQATSQPGVNQPGLPQGANFPGAPGTPAQGYNPGQVPGQYPAGTPYPGQQPGAVNPQISGMPGGMPGGFQPGTSGLPGSGGGQDPSQSAAQAIMRGLTTPRPGGLAGVQQGNMQGMGGAGPGIAGVATKFEGASIRVYNDRKKYQEWEFVYDMSKDPALNQQAGGNQQQQQKGSVSNPGFGSFNNSGGQGQNQGSLFNSGSSFGQQPQPQPSTSGPP